MSSKLRLWWFWGATSKCPGGSREKINTVQVSCSSCQKGLGQEARLQARTQRSQHCPSAPPTPPRAVPTSCLLSWTSQGGDIDRKWVQTLEYNSVIIRKKTHVKTLWCFPCHRYTCPVTTGLGSSTLLPFAITHTRPGPQPILRVQAPKTLESWNREKVVTKGSWGDKTTQSKHLSTYYVQSFIFPMACIIIRYVYILCVGSVFFVCLPLPDTRMPAPWSRDLCMFCQLLCPQHLEERLTHSTHTINMCWINEWKHYANLY